MCSPYIKTLILQLIELLTVATKSRLEYSTMRSSIELSNLGKPKDEIVNVDTIAVPKSLVTDIIRLFMGVLDLLKAKTVMEGDAAAIKNAVQPSLNFIRETVDQIPNFPAQPMEELVRTDYDEVARTLADKDVFLKSNLVLAKSMIYKDRDVNTSANEYYSVHIP